MGYIGAHGVAALHRYKYSGVDHSYVANIEAENGMFDYTYGIHVFGYVCITWIYIFTSVGLTSAKMGSFCAWIVALLVSRCDSLACAFESLAFGSTAMCGRNAFWFWVISTVPFYCVTWESYFTNTLILPVVNGPTEGLMLIYVTHFFTAFVGIIPTFLPYPKLPCLQLYRIMDTVMTCVGAILCNLVLDENFIKVILLLNVLRRVINVLNKKLHIQTSE
ncbi:choline/ethanolaminephosphotransferase 1 [Phtheirospermum japonicum]|uniref:Choline/ethanolaminephosphotransferase 1 n=1 Tax=Phtheirospermum japonicum TaxID=374723 RepID=A0A830BRP5_9LAMI|nr:choline/ethanolaminephosphotransferase 1 [Phtheirospermum japonicum]